MKAKCVFLDRDGTIIEHVGYIADPDDVRLLPGAAEAIRRFTEDGYLILVVSNQSGVARGLFDEATLSRVHDRMVRLLAEQSVRLDGAYYCPYLDGPDARVNAYRRDSELRKPRAGMLRQAAKEHSIDLAQSWMIGDSDVDVEAGRRAGCRTILLSAGPVAPGGARATHHVASLQEACDLVISKKTVEKHTDKTESSSDRDDALISILQQIRRDLRHSDRLGRQHDFSVLRLFATLIQMFAVAAALWGLVKLFGDMPDPATAYFALACFLQLASLGAFAADRFR